MRVAGEAIARQAGIENGDLAAGTAELQGGGEAGKAAADDDDVIHGDGLRVVNGGGGLGLARRYDEERMGHGDHELAHDERWPSVPKKHAAGERITPSTAVLLRGPVGDRLLRHWGLVGLPS